MLSPDFRAQTRQVWREDWPCYAVLLCYAVIGHLLVHILNGYYQPIGATLRAVGIMLALMTVWYVLAACYLATQLDRNHPLFALPRAARQLLTARTCFGVVMCFSVALFMNAFMAVKRQLSGLVGGYTWDQRLADIDRWLHGGHDPWQLLMPLLDNNVAAAIIRLSYEPVWFISITLTPVLLVVSRTPIALRRQYFYTYGLCWFLLGNVLAAAFMSGGPVYFGAFTGDELRFAPIREQLLANPFWYESVTKWQDLLLHTMSLPQDMGIGGISAFPSLHLSMSTLLVLVLVRLHPNWLVPGALFLTVILAGSVHLGWHYAIDGYFSIAATLLIWHMVGLLQRRCAR